MSGAVSPIEHIDHITMTLFSGDDIELGTLRADSRAAYLDMVLPLRDRGWTIDPLLRCDAAADGPQLDPPRQLCRECQ